MAETRRDERYLRLGRNIWEGTEMRNMQAYLLQNDLDEPLWSDNHCPTVVGFV